MARQILNPKPIKPGEALLIASPREQIVQKALQVVMNAIFDPYFSKLSYLFRPGRSSINGLKRIHTRGGPMSWGINGDISKCFDRVPHDTIISSVKERISCARTLTLIERGLKAGYVDVKGQIIKTKIGTPQGSILSPLLSNIVLNKLDKYIESLDSELNVEKKGKTFRVPANVRVVALRSYQKRKQLNLANKYLKKMRLISKFDKHNEELRRAIYIRYADDFVILLASSRKFAISLKEKIDIFLKEACGLEDTLTTLTKTRKGFFSLGAQYNNINKSTIINSFKGKAGNKIARRSTLRMGVDVPIKLLVEKLIQNGFARRNHKAAVLAKGRPDLIHWTHYDIIRFFNSKITGLLTAYPGNFSLMARLI